VDESYPQSIGRKCEFGTCDLWLSVSPRFADQSVGVVLVHRRAPPPSLLRPLTLRRRRCSDVRPPSPFPPRLAVVFSSVCIASFVFSPPRSNGVALSASPSCCFDWLLLYANQVGLTGVVGGSRCTHLGGWRSTRIGGGGSCSVLALCFCSWVCLCALTSYGALINWKQRPFARIVGFTLVD
jgi:hypothetical protein